MLLRNPREEAVHLTRILGKKICISEPARFKPMLFKGQVYNLSLIYRKRRFLKIYLSTSVCFG